MLQKEKLNAVAYPGGNWVYLKLYMGPATADQWIADSLPPLLVFLTGLDKELHFYFIRYLDPDFHLRIRIFSQHPKMLMNVLEAVHHSSSDLMENRQLWKMETATYEREISRYGAERICLFEEAFQADSLFWLDVLPVISAYEGYETLRWKVCLISMIHLYSSLKGHPSHWLDLATACLSSLQNEVVPDKTFHYQLDQKYRMFAHELDLAQILDKSHPLCQVICQSLDTRSLTIQNIFTSYRDGDDYFTWTKGGQNLTDLVHMSLNRGLRSKHRIQEYVLYYFLTKMLRSYLAVW